MQKEKKMIDKKFYSHLWFLILYVPFVFIIKEFLPENKQQAVEQFYLWNSIQDKGDEDSAHLAKALLDENMENTIYKFQFQRKLLLNLHQGMNWFLLDKEINERLKIPSVTSSKIFPKLIIKLNHFTQKYFDLKNPEKYQKLVEIGNKQQMQVLEDYIKHTAKDFHY